MTQCTFKCADVDAVKKVVLTLLRIRVITLFTKQKSSLSAGSCHLEKAECMLFVHGTMAYLHLTECEKFLKAECMLFVYGCIWDCGLSAKCEKFLQKLLFGQIWRLC